MEIAAFPDTSTRMEPSPSLCRSTAYHIKNLVDNGLAPSTNPANRSSPERGFPCSDDVQRRLSAGAKRDLDRRFHILAEHVDSALAETDDAKKWSLWASGVWAGLTFLEDARNTCPAYFRGLHWHNLLKTLTTLCNALEKVDPKIAEIGTRVYERAA